VTDLDAIDRELDVARERDDDHARVDLLTRALALSEAEPHRADLLDELAYAYSSSAATTTRSTRCATRSPPAGPVTSTTTLTRTP